MYIHVHIHSIYIYILHILVTYLACFINFINSIPPQDAKCPEVVRDADLRTDDSLPPQPGTMATYALKRSLRFALLEKLWKKHCDFFGQVKVEKLK